MAVGMHVARVGVFSVDATGNILRKDDADVTIKQQLSSSLEHLVIEDAEVPNSSGYPTVAEYIKLEAADNYVISHIDQTMILTYLRDAAGGYPSP